MRIAQSVGMVVLLIAILASIIWAVWYVTPPSERNSVLSNQESQIEPLSPYPPAPRSICEGC